MQFRLLIGQTVERERGRLFPNTLWPPNTSDRRLIIPPKRPNMGSLCEAVLLETLDEQTPSLMFIVFDLNSRSFSSAVCGLQGLQQHSRPLNIDASGLPNDPRLVLSSCHLSDHTLRQQLLVCSENHVDFGFGVHHLAYFRKSSGGGETEKISGK